MVRNARWQAGLPRRVGNARAGDSNFAEVSCSQAKGVAADAEAVGLVKGLAAADKQAAGIALGVE